MEDDLQESKSNLTSLISDSDLVVVTTYGKSVPKKCNLSPDGWFQVARICVHLHALCDVEGMYTQLTVHLSCLDGSSTYSLSYVQTICSYLRVSNHQVAYMYTL